MKVYRHHLGWILPIVVLEIVIAIIPFLTRDFKGLWFVALFGVVVCAEVTTRIIMSSEGLCVSMRFLPFVPPWHKQIRWTDIIQVQPGLNFVAIEAEGLMIKARSPTGKYQWLLIQIPFLARRREFLQEFTSYLPPHVPFPTEVRRWAETLGITPKWQLLVALGVIGVLAVEGGM